MNTKVRMDMMYIYTHTCVYIYVYRCRHISIFGYMEELIILNIIQVPTVPSCSYNAHACPFPSILRRNLQKGLGQTRATRDTITVAEAISSILSSAPPQDSAIPS